MKFSLIQMDNNLSDDNRAMTLGALLAKQHNHKDLLLNVTHPDMQLSRQVVSYPTKSSGTVKRLLLDGSLKSTYWTLHN